MTFYKMFLEVYSEFLEENNFRIYKITSLPGENRSYFRFDKKNKLLSTIGYFRKPGYNGVKPFEIFCGVMSLNFPIQSELDLFFGIEMGSCSRVIWKRKGNPPKGFSEDQYLPWIEVLNNEKETKNQILDSFEVFTTYLKEHILSNNLEDIVNNNHQLFPTYMKSYIAFYDFVYLSDFSKAERVLLNRKRDNDIVLNETRKEMNNMNSIRNLNKSSINAIKDMSVSQLKRFQEDNSKVELLLEQLRRNAEEIRLGIETNIEKNICFLRSIFGDDFIVDYE